MNPEKKYYSIREVSEMLDIKEHVIRHWDSIDPKTNKLRIEDLSLRTKGGTRFFNKNHIKKIIKLKNILKEDGKRIYSLDLASKIIKNEKYRKEKQVNFSEDSLNLKNKLHKIQSITNNLKKLIK